MALSNRDEKNKVNLDEFNLLPEGLFSAMSSDDLFVDHSFPPDQSSLIYVYSGEEKYEKMVFKRPHELLASPNLYGIDGICDVQLPWKPSYERRWFLYALAVVSLNQHYLEKLTPGFREFKQGFGKTYTGGFTFQLWRFGKWTEVVVDDTLPVLDGKLAYCPAFGSPPEFWGPLLEKCYAKCHKAYEAIENGDPTSSLTDLTGAICEHYVIQDTAAADFFHVLLKSALNRSLISCWRRQKSYEQPGFDKCLNNSCYSNSSDLQHKQRTPHKCHRLYVVTSVTKFPMRDGTMLEMIRVLNPYRKGTQWLGEFSVSHDASWNAVRPEFMENYRPKQCLESFEFWITYVEFCRHFSDAFLCNSSDPYRCNNTGTERLYKPQAGLDFTNLENLDPDNAPPSNTLHSLSQSKEYLCLPRDSEQSRSNSIEILVRENSGTVKLDSVQRGAHVNCNNWLYSCRSRSVQDSLCRSSDSSLFSPAAPPRNYQRMNVVPTFKSPDRTKNKKTLCNAVPPLPLGGSSNSPTFNMMSSQSSDLFIRRRSTHSNSSSLSLHSSHSNHMQTVLMSGLVDHNHEVDSSSMVSGTSDSESTKSASDVTVCLNRTCHRARLSHSAPLTPRNSRKSINSQASIFEFKMDYFKSHCGWKEIVHAFGKWTGDTSGGPPSDITRHSKNPRILITIAKPDVTHGLPMGEFQGKAHVLLSLMQDYRNRAECDSAMLLVIGFCLYRSKHPEKDEKRKLSKLGLVADVRPGSGSREVSKRFDLDPGCYYMVPYTVEAGKEGKFLVRVLGEKDQVAGKTGCIIS